MTRSAVEGQLSLDFFLEKHTVWRDPENWISGMIKSCGIDKDGVRLARRIFAELPWLEAAERSKVVPVLSGKYRVEGFTVTDVDLFGVFDLTLDYHVCWDRKWAAIKGVPKDRIADIAAWDYGKNAPVFREEV